MGSEVFNADSLFPMEGNNQDLDLGLFEEDPDPGVLGEKNDCTLSETTQFLRIFTTSPRWCTLTPRSRARQLWLLLRVGLHDLVEKEKRAELLVTRLTHGLEPLRRLELEAGLCAVAQDPLGGRLVVLDGKGCLHLHREDGWAREKLLSPAKITGLVAVPSPLGNVGRFVGWGPAGLVILGPDLHLLWQSTQEVGGVQSLEPTYCLLVPPRLLVVAQAGGGLQLWKFCSGGRLLVPQGPCLQPPQSVHGSLTCLAARASQPAHSPRCFAAYGSTVVALDLHSWALVDVRRDLHKTTISDLTYCEEAKAMVTASRDSTVKVWEVDWQIRTVFVGHTGPVTALAVLPNTALVLSASQDGTLRTWDLEAVAQVGEVALCSWGSDTPPVQVRTLLAPASPGWPVLALSRCGAELWRVRELYSPLAQLPAPIVHLQVVPALPAQRHPLLPVRLVCSCADGSVCLLSATTGRTVTALLLEPEDCVVAVAYCLPLEALWLLTRAGHLLRSSAARCPMAVLHRVQPPPAPEPQPCCLHLYSHLEDPVGAQACWKLVCQHGGELPRRDAVLLQKDKNRYLPVVGHTDGALSVLEWHSARTVFHTKAHSPGPVTAIESSWNTVVTSGADLTVKMWRVFPYAEDSLSLLRTFSCCHPVVALCMLGTRIIVGFESPDTATYGLVQLVLRNHLRYDHRPQDDPSDPITGLCSCPTLKLYASSSLDCTIRIWTTENRLLRLLQLSGPPQALTFCNDSGDLVLALGSRLCLVSHRSYLPTSYLVKKLCRESPGLVDDPPLPLTSQSSLTSSQLQRLASLHGVTRLSTMLSSTHHQKAKFQQSVLQEVECFLSIRPLYQDLEALAARDQDLQRLRLGHVVPVVRAMPSLKQRQEAFDNYLRLIYGPGLVELQSKRPSQQWSYMTLSTDSRTLPTASSFHWWAEDFMKGQPMPPVLPPKDLGTLCQRLLRPPRVPLPLVPASREVHSQASQLLAKSSLSCSLGLSLDLQLQSDHFWKGAQVFLETLPSDLPKKILRRRHPKELHSSPQGFFPAAIQTPNQKLRLQPILSSSFIPNSVVLQHLWQQEEMGGLGTLVHLSPDDRHKPRASWDNLRLSQTTRRRSSRWQHRLLHLLEEKLEVEDEEEEVEEEDKEEEGEDWIQVQTFHSWQMSGSKESLQGSESEAKSIPPPGPHTSHFSTRHRLRHRSSPWEKRLAHLPGFLQYFVSQNWFKKLFPTFTLEAYPEMSTVEGLASLLMDLLEGASWDEGVHILAALLRLLPEVSGDLCRHLQGILVHLLNLDQPPSLQDRTQKQFVMLALQLLLACTLESRDVVLELLSYFLYSPAECQAELRKLLYALGLQDPQGILFKEMKTWVPGSQMDSKAWLRNCCHQKLEDMVQNLQNLTDVLRLPEEEPQAWRQDSTLKSTLSRAGQPLPWAVTPPEDTIEARLGSAASSADGRLESVRDDNRALGKVPPQVELGTAPQKSLTKPSLVQQSRWHTRQTLSDSLQAFHMVPEVLARSVPAKAQDLSKMFEQMHGVGLHGLQLPLEQTQWSQAQLMDMEYIDALNLFCERQLAQQWGLRQEEPKTETKHESPVRHVPNTVVPQPLDRRYHPVPRLQEPQVQIPRGRKQPWLCAGGPLRLLKLPLPRVEPQPFPPDWPMPARPLPPLLLQPSLQRYFVPDKADPDKYS